MVVNILSLAASFSVFSMVSDGIDFLSLDMLRLECWLYGFYRGIA